MKILVTGATGFIGGNLVATLVENKQYEVTCLVRDEKKGKKLAKQYDVTYVIGDITQEKSLSILKDEFEIIFHLAAMGHVSAVSEEACQIFININEGGTRNLINHFRDSKILKKFIHFSSTAAMGPIGEPILDEKSIPNPLTPYQISKNRSEQLSLKAYSDFGFPTIVIRPCMVYGIGGYGEFYKFCRLMKKGIFPKVGRGENLTPLVNVKDVVQAAINAMLYGKCGEVYIIASEKSIKMDDLHSLIVNSIGCKSPYIYVPVWLALIGSKILENLCKIIGKEPVVTFRNIKSTITNRTFCIDKAKKEIKYEPIVSFEEGIYETIDWYKNEGRI